MESMIIQGASASGFYAGKPGMYLSVQNIDFSVPMSGTLTNASITLSGAYGNTKYTFNNDTDVCVRFAPNEDVYVTTSNFAAGYSAIINYIEGGDMASYMQYDTVRISPVEGTNTFWRYR